MSSERVLRWGTRLYGACALALLAAGSLVNSHRAQLSVPDWPLSYGRLLLAAWPGNTFYEQLHRLTAAATLVVGVAVWAAAARAGHPARRAAARLLELLGAQVLLGGLVVLTLDPPAVAALHVLLAQLVGAGTVLLSLRLEVGTERRAALAALRLRSTRLLPWLLLVQVALGALSWHPPAGRAAGIGTLLAHTLLGPAIVGVAVTAGVALARRGQRGPGGLLLLVATAQLVAGVAVFLVAPDAFHPEWPPPPGFPTWHALHHVFAALFLGVAVFLRRPERPARGQRSGPSPESSASR